MSDIVRFILLKAVAIVFILLIVNGTLLLFFSEVYTTITSAITLVLLNLVVVVDKILQPLIIQKKKATISHRYNALVLVILILAIPFAATLPYVEYLCIEKALLPLEVIFACWVLGTLMLIIGGPILWISRFTLGKQASLVVGIEKEHKLITSGPYHIIRHPIYSGSILFVLGYTLSFCSLVITIILTLVILKVLKTRMTLEEKMLIETFGDEYQQYMKRTKRLIPHIY